VKGPPKWWFAQSLTTMPDHNEPGQQPIQADRGKVEPQVSDGNRQCERTLQAEGQGFESPKLHRRSEAGSDPGDRPSSCLYSSEVQQRGWLGHFWSSETGLALGSPLCRLRSALRCPHSPRSSFGPLLLVGSFGGAGGGSSAWVGKRQSRCMCRVCRRSLTARSGWPAVALDAKIAIAVAGRFGMQ
jgi:hypothetical protein